MSAGIESYDLDPDPWVHYKIPESAREPSTVYEAEWDTGWGRDRRRYEKPGHVKSALTQLPIRGGLEVWRGKIYWEDVTEEFVK